MIVTTVITLYSYIHYFALLLSLIYTEITSNYCNMKIIQILISLHFTLNKINFISNKANSIYRPLMKQNT